MSFEDEMRLHYLTVSFEESWDCINDGVRWWLTACAPLFYEKHWEIAYKSWKSVNTRMAPWSRVGVVQTLDIGCNVLLQHSFPTNPRHCMRDVLVRVAQDPANKGREAVKRLREQSFHAALEDCFLRCISAMQNGPHVHAQSTCREAAT